VRRRIKADSRLLSPLINLMQKKSRPDIGRTDSL
jgi:hypothetical protein